MTSAWRDPSEMVGALAALRFVDVFNPYSDVCPKHDLPDAPAVRRNNLTLLLRAAIDRGAPVLWVGQDLGRLGGRRTGLPLTDEPGFEKLQSYWDMDGLRRATHGPPATEPTAGFVWKALADEPQQVFFWNAFPLQPCRPGGSALNRGHRTSERKAASEFLPWIVATLRPRKVVALGRIAQKALCEVGVSSVYVRHPGRGGGPAFLAGLSRLRGA